MDSVDNSSFSPQSETCIVSITSRYIFTAWFTVYLLLLPVFLFVLYIGFNKWKKPQSASGGLSHSDVFTLHMVAMEIAGVLGSCGSVYGYFRLDDQSMKVGGNIMATAMTGQTLFHSLTCVERYLAVVHPVIYLRLRREGGVTVRNISIAVVWVCCIVSSVPMSLLSDKRFYGIFAIVLSTASMPLVAYCSVHVLCVLIRPKPGERGGQRRKIDQSMRSTVYTMVAILGAVLLRLLFYVVTGCINILLPMEVNSCAVITATLWSSLPSSLVLPLLFLHRTRNK